MRRRWGFAWLARMTSHWRSTLAARVLRVAIVKTLQPPGYTILGWIVPDIAKAVRDLVKRGVIFQRYEGMPQDDLGIWSSPSGARVAWFADPEDNTLSLTELARPTSTKVKRKRS